MAAIMRPSLLSQSSASIPSRRLLLTSFSAVKSLHPTFIRPASTLIPRQSHTFHKQKPSWRSPSSPPATTFHTTSRRQILPMGPQVIDGTANDPAPVPKPEPVHGSYHWTFERLISIAVIPLTIAPFAAGTLNPATDAILCATLVIHSHIGFQSIIIDYIPTGHYPRTRTVFWWGLRAATLSVALGLYEFETNDVGLTEGIKRIWTA